MRTMSILMVKISAAVFVASLIILSFNRVASADLIEWPVSEGGNGHYYGVTPFGCWTEAESFAESLGGHLITIDDSAENEFIRLNFLNISGSQQDFWIGYKSFGVWPNPNTWGWISGAISTYQNWRPGQPDYGYLDGEDDIYAAINFIAANDGRWDNYPNCVFRKPRGIFEIDPIDVKINILPGNLGNDISLASIATLPVAILSSSSFDAAQVINGTVTLSAAKVGISAVNNNVCTTQDLDGDGRNDLLCNLQTTSSVVAGSSMVELEAQTLSGKKLRGWDFINIIP